MPVSADVSAGDTILASQHNNLRQDATNELLGHLHDGIVGNAPPILPKPMLFDAGGTAFFTPGWDWINFSSYAMVADRLYYVPIGVQRSTTYVRIMIRVTVAGTGGSVIRMGIYSSIFDADSQLTPDALTLDAGTVAADSTGDKEITISQTLAAGFHFLAFSSDSSPFTNGMLSTSGFTSPISPPSEGGINGPFYVIFVGVVDGAAALPNPATVATGIEGMNRTSVRLRV